MKYSTWFCHFFPPQSQLLYTGNLPSGHSASVENKSIENDFVMFTLVKQSLFWQLDIFSSMLFKHLFSI